jgi:hypothetical protein
MGLSLHDGPFTMEKTVEAVNSINTNLFEKCEDKLWFASHIHHIAISPITTNAMNKITSRAKLTTSGEIAELETLLEKKRSEMSIIHTKYNPIVDFVAEAIEKDELDYKLVLSLLSDRFE